MIFSPQELLSEIELVSSFRHPDLVPEPCMVHVSFRWFLLVVGPFFSGFFKQDPGSKSMMLFEHVKINGVFFGFAEW